jgi:hypothetical protein
MTRNGVYESCRDEAVLLSREQYLTRQFYCDSDADLYAAQYGTVEQDRVAVARSTALPRALPYLDTFHKPRAIPQR